MIGALANLFPLMAMSLLAFGAVASTLPAMVRAVIAHHWMTRTQFLALFGLARSAPGSNMLIAPLVGLRVAGVPGAWAGTFEVILPSSILTIIATQTWERFHTARWRRALQAAITPISGGSCLLPALFLAGMQTTVGDWAW